MTNIKDIKLNPSNPRTISDEKLAKLTKSIKDFPEMLKLRPIVVNNDMVVLGGNMRLKAAEAAGLTEIPILKASDLTQEQQREFIIKDNVGFGEWDWELIGLDWDSEVLSEWGMEVVSDTGWGEDFELPDGDKEPFQQMTFTLADEQAVIIQDAIKAIKQTDNYKEVETFGNENSNGNALYLLINEQG